MIGRLHCDTPKISEEGGKGRAGELVSPIAPQLGVALGNIHTCIYLSGETLHCGRRAELARSLGRFGRWRCSGPFINRGLFVRAIDLWPL
jgi:hypothetical protein